jgi:hypothetical protein
MAGKPDPTVAADLAAVSRASLLETMSEFMWGTGPVFVAETGHGRSFSQSPHPGYVEQSAMDTVRQFNSELADPLPDAELGSILAEHAVRCAEGDAEVEAEEAAYQARQAGVTEPAGKGSRKVIEGSALTWRALAYLASPACKIAPEDRFVFTLLVAHTNRKTGTCNPSVAYLAGLLHRDERTIRGSIRGLIDAGVVRIVDRGGLHHANRYRVTLT